MLPGLCPLRRAPLEEQGWEPRVTVQATPPRRLWGLGDRCPLCCSLLLEGAGHRPMLLVLGASGGGFPAQPLAAAWSMAWHPLAPVSEPPDHQPPPLGVPAGSSVVGPGGCCFLAFGILRWFHTRFSSNDTLSCFFPPTCRRTLYCGRAFPVSMPVQRLCGGRFSPSCSPAPRRMYQE